MLYACALKIVKNSADAEDVLHDCFVNIFTAAAGYRPHGKPMAWIITIAKNLCFARLRQHNRQEQAGQVLKRQCVEVAKAIHVGAAPCNAASPLNRKRPKQQRQGQNTPDNLISLPFLDFSCNDRHAVSSFHGSHYKEQTLP